MILTGTPKEYASFSMKLRYNKNFVTKFYPWNMMPGRDLIWKEYMVGQIGIDLFKKEFELVYESDYSMG